MAWPFFLYTQRAEYQGLVPFRSADDGTYENRIQTALLGRFDEVDNGITGPGIRGAGSALVERVTGFLLQGTGLRGPEAAAVLIVTIAPLFFLFFVLFLRSIGITAAWSLIITAVYTLMMLGTLQRPVNLSFTLPFTALTLLLFSKARQKGNAILILLAALCIGLLPGIYFWAWTFLWAGIACVYLLHAFLPASPLKHSQIRSLVFIAGIALLVTIPLLTHTWLMQLSQPTFADVGAERSGMYHSYEIESPVRSFLFLVLTLAGLSLFFRKKEQRISLILPAGLMLGGFLAMHQNVIHGKDLMFSSHYYPFLCLAAVTLSAWVFTFDRVRYRIKSIESWFIIGATVVLLAAGFSDYRISWILPFAPAKHLDLQHLAPVLNQLNDGDRQMILSDPWSALMVKAWTDDDVVFTPYVQSLYVSDEEYIERYCLAESFGQIPVERIAFELTQYFSIEKLPARMAQVQEVCDRFLADSAKALRRYGVEFVLWNKKSRPDWMLDSRQFTDVSTGEGWSLWRVVY